MAEKVAVSKRDPGVVMAIVMAALAVIPFVGITLRLI